MDTSRNKGSKSAQLMEVIVVTTSVGKGTSDDPIRIVTEYWAKSGELLAVNDPHLDGSVQ